MNYESIYLLNIFYILYFKNNNQIEITLILKFQTLQNLNNGFIKKLYI